MTPARKWIWLWTVILLITTAAVYVEAFLLFAHSG
jgi:hypothetical protein